MSKEDAVKKWFERYKKVSDEAASISLRKQYDYGPENVGSLGIKGLIPRINDKFARLKNLIWDKDQSDMKVCEESIEDTALDLANYALFLVMVLRGVWYSEKKL